MQIHVFTDGSCLNNGKENAKASFSYQIYEETNDFFCEIFRETNVVPQNEKQSNNTGELFAIKNALKFLIENGYKKKKIQIFTDSMYCINSVSDDGDKWYVNWEKSGWKKPIENNKLIRDIIVTHWV